MGIVKLVLLLDGLVSLLDVLERFLYLGEVVACIWRGWLRVYSLLDGPVEDLLLFV
jgi:hypothetical protein